MINSNNIDTAISSIQKSIDSHISWRDYRLSNGDDCPECGDLNHHEQCLKEYENVMNVLKYCKDLIVNNA